MNVSSSHVYILFNQNNHFTIVHWFNATVINASHAISLQVTLWRSPRCWPVSTRAPTPGSISPSQAACVRTSLKLSPRQPSQRQTRSSPKRSVIIYACVIFIRIWRQHLSHHNYVEPYDDITINLKSATAIIRLTWIIMI